MAKLAEVLKYFTRQEALQLVAEAHGSPVLCSYSNDGTPMRVRTSLVTTGTMGKVRRTGAAGHELLVQRAMFRTRGGSEGWKTAMQVGDPLPLVHGKGADAMFSASVEFVQTLRQMGHGGIAVQHYAFDRAMHSALVRRFKQHHALAASRTGGPMAGATGAHRLFHPAYLEWVADTTCVNHVVHNALKWGLFQWLTDEGLMKIVFVVIESIRQGHSFLEAELNRWLVRVVKWVEEEELMDPMEAAAFWCALGVEPKWADHLVDLGLVWRGDRLLVNIKHRFRPESWVDIINCVRHSFKFTKFSDSRWCTLGRSCRQVIHAQLLGLSSLMRAVLADPSNSEYLVSGFRQLSPAVQFFISVAAFASWPSEGLLAELLEDDRLCLHSQSYQGRLQHEMSSIIALPSIVWEHVSALCPSETTASSLRSRVLNCAHTSIGFIGTRVWQRCKAWPWKLAIGDIAKHIKELAAMPAPPDESLTRKVWYLANNKFPEDQLLEGVQLLQHIGWSSTTVEQQHASATLVKRVHHTYGLQMLTGRAVLHTARLFYSVDPLDRQGQKLQLRLREQLDGATARIPANAILFKEVMELQKFKGKERTFASGSGLTRGQVHKRMDLANKHWNKVSGARREELRSAARIEEAKRHR